MQSSELVAKISTNGRASHDAVANLRRALLRLGLRGAEVVAPVAADRYAASLFFHPQRGELRSAPALAGHTARAFTVSSGDAELAAFSWGEGPTVVFAHGWQGHAGQLMSFAGPLVARGYRVVTFDMPGHGRSSGVRCTVLDMARAIRDVARETAPLLGAEAAEPHAIVAHSLGGAATARALLDGLSPRRVVLVAPAAEPLHFARGAAAILGLSQARTAGMLDQVVAGLGGALDDVDVRAFGAHLRPPALVFHDPADADVPFAHGEQIAARWAGAAGAELVATPGLGHRQILRDPAVVARAVAFIDG